MSIIFDYGYNITLIVDTHLSTACEPVFLGQNAVKATCKKLFNADSVYWKTIDFGDDVSLFGSNSSLIYLKGIYYQ